MSTDVLMVGSGGREHALLWKLAQSRRIGKLFVAPGNGGTRQVATNIAIRATDIDELVRFASHRKIGLTVVGPDDALALGIVDAFRTEGLRIFGPSRTAAEIEWSKAFSKTLMHGAGVPTAAFKVFKKYDDAIAHVRTRGTPIVVKAAGLALGKGVSVCASVEDAEHALADLMVRRVRGDAGNEVVVEEFLEGQEISVHAFCDGRTFVMFPTAQDHKPIGDNDIGKNTGGMGTIAPVPWVNSSTARRIERTIVRTTLEKMEACNRQFEGVLYPGLKMTSRGPKVLEYNARFGDPETQSYMRLLKTDLLDILEACVDGTLNRLTIEWHGGFAVCIVIASKGYPDAYEIGIPIRGIKAAERTPGVVVFHAGTVFDRQLRTAGGRVLGVTATGDTLRGTLEKAYEAARRIKFRGMYYRHDIGAKALGAL